MNTFKGLYSKILYTVIYINTIILILISLYLFFGAYANHRIGFILITDTLKDISLNPCLTEVNDPNILSARGEAYLNKIEMLSNEFMNSNITSFFSKFLIFVMSIICATLLMFLTSLSKEVSKRKEECENIYRHFEEEKGVIHSKVNSFMTSLNLSFTYYKLQKIEKYQSIKMTDKLLAYLSFCLLDGYRELKEKLEGTIGDEDYHLEPALSKEFLDINSNTKSFLNSLKGKIRYFDDINKLCIESDSLLMKLVKRRGKQKGSGANGGPVLF